jgi:hypothetical protein
VVIIIVVVIFIVMDVALGDVGHCAKDGKGHQQAAVERVLDGLRGCEFFVFGPVGASFPW